MMILTHAVELKKKIEYVDTNSRGWVQLHMIILTHVVELKKKIEYVDTNSRCWVEGKN